MFPFCHPLEIVGPKVAPQKVAKGLCEEMVKFSRWAQGFTGCGCHALLSLRFWARYFGGWMENLREMEGHSLWEGQKVPREDWYENKFLVFSPRGWEGVCLHLLGKPLSRVTWDCGSETPVTWAPFPEAPSLVAQAPRPGASCPRDGEDQWEQAGTLSQWVFNNKSSETDSRRYLKSILNNIYILHLIKKITQ